MKQNNNIPIFIGLSIAFGIILGSFFNIRNVENIYQSSGIKDISKLGSIIKHIENNYVDEVDTYKITEQVIDNLLNELDPHSRYLPLEDHQSSKETMNGNFVGIGVQFVQKKDTVVVVKVLEDGPSKKAGILAGDRLLIANLDSLYGKNLKSNAVVSKLKGIENTQVNVKVYRPSVKKTIDFRITRGKVAIKSIPVSFKLNNTLGYIKIDRFAITTYKEFKKALDNLLNEGMTDLVLDLRGNPGGYLEIANKICDEFLADGKLIVYTKNKKGRQKNYVATSKGSFEKGHVYVLVDENSASASEIVSGALQDNDQGTILGRRTFGKGLVQNQIDFRDGSAMRLTTARYYTPTGRSIQKPYQNNTYDNEVLNRYKSGELFYKDSIKVIDSLKFETPKGKIVYGGGGITPDVFIPLDTVSSANYYEISLVNNFVYNYIDKNREHLKKYTDENFIDAFKITNDVLKEFKSFNQIDSLVDLTKLKFLLKQSFAKTLVSEKVFYQLSQKRDFFIAEVLKIEQNAEK